MMIAGSFPWRGMPISWEWGAGTKRCGFMTARRTEPDTPKLRWAHTFLLLENWELVSLEFVATSVLAAIYLMIEFEVAVAFWHFGWQGW